MPCLIGAALVTFVLHFNKRVVKKNIDTSLLDVEKATTIQARL